MIELSDVASSSSMHSSALKSELEKYLNSDGESLSEPSGDSVEFISENRANPDYLKSKPNRTITKVPS